MEEKQIGKDLMIRYLTELIWLKEQQHEIIVPVDVALLRNILALLQEKEE